MKLLSIAALAAGIALAGAAQAAPVYNVTLWIGSPLGNVDSSKTASEAGKPTSAVFTHFTWTGPINWVNNAAQNSTPAGNLVKDFLTGGAISGFSSGLYANQTAFENASLSVNGDAYSAFFRITGSYNSASSYAGSINHDDGASLYIDGSPVFQSPGETTVALNTFVAPAGSHSFVLDYVEGNGSPSVLQVSLPTSVPEPAEWALMLLGFGAIGVTLRGSRRRAVAA